MGENKRQTTPSSDRPIPRCPHTTKMQDRGCIIQASGNRIKVQECSCRHEMLASTLTAKARKRPQVMLQILRAKKNGVRRLDRGCSGRSPALHPLPAKCSGCTRRQLEVTYLVLAASRTIDSLGLERSRTAAGIDTHEMVLCVPGLTYVPGQGTSGQLPQHLGNVPKVR